MVIGSDSHLRVVGIEELEVHMPLTGLKAKIANATVNLVERQEVNGAGFATTFFSIIKLPMSQAPLTYWQTDCYDWIEFTPNWTIFSYGEHP